MQECNTNCPWETLCISCYLPWGISPLAGGGGGVGQAGVSPSASLRLLELPTLAIGGGDLQQCGCNRRPLSSSVSPPPYQMGGNSQYTRRHNLTQHSSAMFEIAGKFATYSSKSGLSPTTTPEIKPNWPNHMFVHTCCPGHFNSLKVDLIRKSLKGLSSMR